MGGETKLKKFRGVNLTDPATEIADNEFAWARNCDGDELGYVGPRQVQRVIENAFNPASGLYDKVSKVSSASIAMTAPNDAAFELGMYQFLDKNNTHRLVYWIPFFGNGSTGVAGEPLGFFMQTLQGITGLADAPTIETPLESGALGSILRRPAGSFKKPTSLVHNNELYLFLGHTYPGLILGADDFGKGTGGLPKFRQLGAAWKNGSDDFKPKFSFGDVYRGVFVLGGLDAPFESLVAFTETGDTPGKLLDVNKWAGFGFGDGDKLVTVKTVPVIGGSVAVEPYCIAFKQRSVWMMQGQPPSSTDAGTLVITPVVREEGLISAASVCVTPLGLFWCSGLNVWWMPPGQEPVSIGDNISGFLEKLPQTPSAAWSLTFHANKLYLNFPWPQGMVDGKTYGGNERKYLGCGQLWCDLRKLKKGNEEDPAGPRWWGPQDVRASCMLSLNMADGSRQLAGLVPWWESTSYIIQPFTMAKSGIDFQDPTTGAITARGYDLQDSGDNGGTGGIGFGDVVPASTVQILKTREMDFGDGDLEKIINGVSVNALWDIALGSAVGPAIGADYPLLLGWLKNTGRALKVPQPPIAETEDHSATSPQSPGFILDENLLDSDVRLSETYIPLKFWPVDGERFLARTFQIMLQSTQVQDALVAGDDDIRTRRFSIRHITIDVHLIGRRPNTYGE